MGALGFCAPVCALWRGARGPWRAYDPSDSMDRGGNGSGAVCRYGIQPASRRFHRCHESSYPGARLAFRGIDANLCEELRRSFFSDLRIGGSGGLLDFAQRGRHLFLLAVDLLLQVVGALESLGLGLTGQRVGLTASILQILLERINVTPSGLRRH